jgi:hypothetical protein
LSSSLLPRPDLAALLFYHDRALLFYFALTIEHFGEDEVANGDSKPVAREPKASSVVAPASRSRSPKKIRLTNTQLAVAKKFGLTPEQYAREVMKMEN